MIWPLLYAALWKLAPPLIGHYLRRRARKQPEYLQHWDERWARGESRADDAHGAIWVHAVSVGETRAAAPLVAALRARWPDKPLLITQMTPTGRETALSLYPDACVRYLPYDAPDAVARFLGRYQPMFGVLMETELWPHLIAGCRAHGVPLFLANARLSERSARGYRRAAGLIGPALASLDGVAAQSEDDAARAIGAAGRPARRLVAAG
jgi:3-deoxy-D-manno-octulosonic-acid transferase